MIVLHYNRIRYKCKWALPFFIIFWTMYFGVRRKSSVTWNIGTWRCREKTSIYDITVMEKSVHYTAGKHSYTLSVSRKTENSMYSLYTHPKRYLCFSNCHNLLLCMFVQTTFLLYTILHFILSFLHHYRIVSLFVINNHNLLV